MKWPVKPSIIGPSMKARREALGMTQAALARALNVKPARVYFLERYASKTSAALLRRIAKALMCTPSDLLPTPGAP